MEIENFSIGVRNSGGGVIDVHLDFIDGYLT
jgi:hypothetical protein